MESKQYYVYILSSISRVLYVGMTNNLIRRVGEHRDGKVPGFTKKYRVVKKLVYFEGTTDVLAAISREKQIEKWRREKKTHLFEKMNPDWRDLYPELVSSERGTNP